MFNADVDPLADDTISYRLVDLNADCPLCNIPYNSSSPMVKLMRHTLVNGAVSFDIYVIPNLICSKIFR